MSKVPPRALPRKKLKSVSFYKKKLDALVSRYVRLSSSSGETSQCYTCGLERPKLELQCGHFISRQYNATRYDLENLRVQCPNCNIWRRGNIAFFSANLLAELGKERFEALIARGRKRKEYSVPELLEEIETYKSKLLNQV